MSDTNQETEEGSTVKRVKKGQKLTPNAKMKDELRKHSEALDQLKGVPERINQIFELLSRGSSEQPEFSNPVPDETDPADPMNEAMNILLVNQEKESTPGNPSSSELEEIVNTIEPDNELGDPIHADVALSLNRLYKAESTKQAKEKAYETFRVPENCHFMGIPKVNPEIWPLLPTNVRQRDFNLQQQQRLATTAAVAISSLTETLFTTKDLISPALRDKLLKGSLQAISVLGLAWDEANRQRKGEIRPSLNKEFKNICTTSKATGELLFGNNITDQLKASKSSSQMVRGVMRPERFINRFSPYKRQDNRPLNFQGPSYRRGTMQRGYRSRPMMRGRGFPNKSRFNQQ